MSTATITALLPIRDTDGAHEARIFGALPEHERPAFLANRERHHRTSTERTARLNAMARGRDDVAERRERLDPLALLRRTLNPTAAA